MQSARDGEIKTKGNQSLNLRQTRMGIILVSGLTILYIATFHPLLERVGPVSFILISLPVALAGWYFGVNAGLIASAMGIALSAALHSAFEGTHWYSWIIMYWPGNLIVVVVGYIAGYVQKGLAERAQVLDELRSRERYLTLVNMTTRDLLNTQDTDSRYIYLINHLVNLFVADYAHLIRWDETLEKAVLVASTIPLEQPFSYMELDAEESTIVMSVLGSRHALPIDDVPNSGHVVNPSLFRELSLPTRSALGIPLVVKEHKFGAAILAFDTPHRFSVREINQAELTANQIALALWTLEQDFEIRKSLKETNALANIERALSETERVGFETVLQLIVYSAQELIPGAEQAVLHLLDDDGQVLIPRAVAGNTDEAHETLHMHLGEGVAGQALATGKLFVVSDVETDPQFLNQARPGQFRSLVVTPIQTNDRPVGTLSIHSSQPKAFTASDSRLLGALGTQAAIAIENANLLETTQQNLKEINALYLLSQGLAASLDPDQLMKDVVSLLQVNFQYYHIQIFVVDPHSGDLVASYGAGEIGNQLREQGFCLHVGEGIVGHVAETGQPFFTNEVDKVAFFKSDPLLPDIRSELALPIVVDDQVVGVLDIQQSSQGRLTARDMQLMSAVADQLAVALQKSSLVAKLQEALNLEQATRSKLIQTERLAVIGRLMASVSHELSNPLQALQNALFLLREEKGISNQGRQDLQILLEETDRMAAMIERLRPMYRPTRVESFQPVQINQIVENVYPLVATHLRHKGIAYEFSPDPKLPTVPGLPDQLKQVVLNLVMNSVDAMPSGGRLYISTTHVLEKSEVLLSISDNGLGIDPAILPNIFDAFVTNKETGTGLGLTITYDIVRQHEGNIKGENNPGGGATFKVWLPVAKKKS